MKTVAENPVLLQFKAESQEHLEAMNQHLEAYGITLYDRSTQTSYGTITNFCDPDGNRLEILYEG
jgi:predicted lactoylglutathione lyase